MVTELLHFEDFDVWPHNFINIQEMCTKNNRVLLLTMMHLYTKYDKHPSLHCRVRVNHSKVSHTCMPTLTWLHRFLLLSARNQKLVCEKQTFNWKMFKYWGGWVWTFPPVIATHTLYTSTFNIYARRPLSFGHASTISPVYLKNSKTGFSVAEHFNLPNHTQLSQVCYIILGNLIDHKRMNLSWNWN